MDFLQDFQPRNLRRNLKISFNKVVSRNKGVRSSYLTCFYRFLGLLEDASYFLTTTKQRKILTKLFHSTCLFNVSRKYFPFLSRNEPAPLGELLRWKIRKDLLINEQIIFAIDVPLHILQMLKYDLPV